MTATTMPTRTLPDFVHYLSTGEDPHGLIADDVVGEMCFPHTTFTVSGKAAFDELRASVSEAPWVMRVGRVESTPSGFAVVIEYDATSAGRRDTYRTVTLVTIEDDQVTRLAHWCSGVLQ